MVAKKAFTLVEILIVVIVLGILAAIVLPQFSNASAKSRASMLADDLRILRTQVMVFKSQHMDSAPGYPGGDATATPTEALFLAHMTMSSKPTCETATPGTAGYRYGPYLSSMPVNPLNGKATVQVIGNSAAFPGSGDDSHGWIYKPATLQVAADSPGSDEGGKSYFGY